MEQVCPANSPVKKMILAARADGDCFWELAADPQKGQEFTDLITIRVSAITGCELRATPLFDKVLSDEVGLMLADFYLDDLTISEICLAVRLNSWPLIKYTGGKDIEKVPIPQKLNVDFLMKILYNYKILRDYMEKEFANKLAGF